MADYINEDGAKRLRFDDSSTAPVVAIVPLSDGLGVALTPTQLAALTPPPNPSSYPLPATQLDALRPPANPATYPLPADQVDALRPPANPTTYPLPADQSGWLKNLRDRVLDFVRGSGDFDTNTLRVVVAANQPEIAAGSPGATSTPISLAAGAPVTSIVTPSTGKRLRISHLELQAASPTQVRWLGGTVPLTEFLELEQFSMSPPEPIVLGVNQAFRIEVSSSTPNVIRGFVVAREVA